MKTNLFIDAMKTGHRFNAALVLALAVILAGCVPVSEATPGDFGESLANPSPSPMFTVTSPPEATFTLTPTAAFTSTPIPSPNPGLVECRGCKITYAAAYPMDNGVSRLYTIDENGSEPTVLTPINLDSVYRFAWSPNGSKIAFQSGSQVYTMNADGSDLVNLTQNLDFYGGPYRSSLAWSPDDSRIAFTFKSNGGYQIYVANPDGSSLVNLGQNLIDRSFIAWAPDGSRIAFAASAKTDLAGLYTINADGSNPVFITVLGYPNRTLTLTPFAWLPDSGRIVFQYCSIGISCELMMINADGNKQKTVTHLTGRWLEGSIDLPAWSPDGVRVTFVSFHPETAKGEIYVMNTDGSNIAQLTKDSNWENPYNLVWSPDGSKIAFQASQQDNEQIFVINADGSGLTQVTQSEGVSYEQIAWTTPLTSTPQPTVPASIVSMAYPGHETCTIQVDTQTWKIDNYWKKNIIGQNNNLTRRPVLISNNHLIYLVGHRIYPGCQVAWATAVGFEESMNLQKSSETINGKNWKIWNINNNAIRVYFLDEFDIRFLQTAPDDIAQEQGCTADVYHILESLSCK